jgi:hypothetical protein
VHKLGYGIENAELSAAALLHDLAKAGLSDDESTRCDGSQTLYRTLDNERLAEREHQPGIRRQYAGSYPVPSFGQAIRLANGSGEVPLQVEHKTILVGIVWSHFKLA